MDVVLELVEVEICNRKIYVIIKSQYKYVK